MFYHVKIKFYSLQDDIIYLLFNTEDGYYYYRSCHLYSTQAHKILSTDLKSPHVLSQANTWNKANIF